MRIGIAIAAVALAVVAGRARADTAWREGYVIEQPEAGTVTIYLHDFVGRGCPDTGLLRRNVATDEVVKITSCSDGSTFIDQCVPAGSSQYGLKDPLKCDKAAGTEFYGTADVTSGAAAGCTRTVTPDPEPASASEVQWRSDSLVCAGSYGKLPPGCSTGGAVLGLNLAVLAAGLALWRRRAGGRRA